MPPEVQLVLEQPDPREYATSTPPLLPRKRVLQSTAASSSACSSARPHKKNTRELTSPHQEVSTVETNGDEDLSSSDSSGGLLPLKPQRSSVKTDETAQASSSLFTSSVIPSATSRRHWPKGSCRRQFRDPSCQAPGTPTPLIPLALRLGAKLFWKLLLICLQMCGLGKDWKSCFTVRQIFWLQLNMNIVNALVCCDPDNCDTHQPANSLHVMPCQVLHRRRQEPPLLWDIFQKILFISSRGKLIAERHGALTEDNHLLILHRIRAVPETVRAQLVRFEDVSFATVLLYFLQRFFRPRGPELIRRSDFSGGAPRPASGTRPLYLFQHGLCESAVNWILPAMTTDIGDERATSQWMAQKLWESLRREIIAFWAAAGRMLQGRQPLQVRGETTIESERMSESFPLRLALDSMLANDGNLETEIWFLNTRGNAFSNVTRRDETRPPRGCGSRPLVEIMRDSVKKPTWTHHDMALLDLEAIFAKLARTYYPDAKDPMATPPLRPVIVAFSQGSAIFLLNAAYRRLIREGLVRSKLRLTPLEPEGMVLLSPPLVLKTWRSPVVTPAETSDELVAIPHPQGEGPIDSVFGEEAVQRMKDFVELMKEKRKGTPGIWRKLCKGDYTASWVFFFFIYKYMTVIIPVMEVAGAWVPSCFMTWTEVMVRRGLGFHVGMLPAGCAKWFYKLTPNGSTSVENVSLWRDRMESGLPLGVNFLDSTSAWHEFNDTDAEYIPLVLSSAIEACPVHIVLGSDDPMVDSAKSIDLIRAQYPQAVVESVPLNPRLLTRNNQIANEESGRRLNELNQQGRICNARLGVKLMQGRSHLDFVWPGPALTNIYKDISACMELWHKQKGARKDGPGPARSETT